MIGFLACRFIKDYQNTSDAAVRRAYGVLCGAVGIAINLLLFALKLFAGTLAGSVAITADAFNNLSDAGASIVTLLGFRLAGQKPDPEHPFGHGRLEYVSGLIVSIVILLMGFELLRDAVGAILHPEAVECSVLTVAILLISICAKFYMYCYNRGVGKKISAAAMQATAADSLSDCAATAAGMYSSLRPKTKSCRTGERRSISLRSGRAIIPLRSATIPSSSVRYTCSVKSAMASAIRCRLSAANPAPGATRASCSFLPARTSAISRRRFSRFSSVSAFGVEEKSTRPSSISG